jgi:UDP-N-acetylmuramyl tripeptide synthase
VLTSDNPRSEDPQAILDEIRVAGAGAESHCRSRRSDRRTILAAHPADVVLIAGKGHEPYQEIAGVRRPFSDVTQARAALTARQEMANDRDDGSPGRCTRHRRQLLGDNVTFCGVSTDSRSIAAGELFVALRGENFDGHDYVAAAKARGAVAAVVAADASRPAGAGSATRSGRRNALVAGCPGRRLARPFHAAADRRHRQQRQDDDQGNDRQHPETAYGEAVLSTRATTTTTSACR